MLFTVPDKIRKKFHYSGQCGGYLEEPYTEEEKHICDEFVAAMKKAEKEAVIIEE